MEVAQPRSVNSAMTFDEVSMERSKSFVKALQELKNLRPQLYSAAEYCEKSYLHNEEKQMVLDNLKDYAVRALVNAVDHLGTVAYKLNDLLEQQTSDVSTMEFKVTCINQQLLTCQTYIEKEGLRQQQLLAVIPKHHKHYILPRSVSKKVHFGPLIQTDTRQQCIQARARLQPSSSPASKSLSWHLGSETKPTFKGDAHAPNSKDGSKIYGRPSGIFHLVDNEATRSSATCIQLTSGVPASNAVMQSVGAARRVTKSDLNLKDWLVVMCPGDKYKDRVEGSKNMKAFRSFDNANRCEIVCVPTRSKSMLSTFFVKPKMSKLKAGPAS